VRFTTKTHKNINLFLTEFLFNSTKEKFIEYIFYNKLLNNNLTKIEVREVSLKKKNFYK
jgi:hypothetical protein